MYVDIPYYASDFMRISHQVYRVPRFFHMVQLSENTENYSTRLWDPRSRRTISPLRKMLSHCLLVLFYTTPKIFGRKHACRHIFWTDLQRKFLANDLDQKNGRSYCPIHRIRYFSLDSCRYGLYAVNFCLIN